MLYGQVSVHTILDLLDIISLAILRPIRMGVPYILRQ
jgi:hypothetical protein